MTRVLPDARLASGLVTRSGRLLQGELVPPSSPSSSSSSTTTAGGPPKRCAPREHQRAKRLGAKAMT